MRIGLKCYFNGLVLVENNNPAPDLCAIIIFCNQTILREQSKMFYTVKEMLRTALSWRGCKKPAL